MSRQQRGNDSPVVRAGGLVEELGEGRLRDWLGGWVGQKISEF